MSEQKNSWAVVADAFNPTTWETYAGKTVNLTPPWSIEQDSQDNQQSNQLNKKKKVKKKRKKIFLRNYLVAKTQKKNTSKYSFLNVTA